MFWDTSQHALDGVLRSRRGTAAEQFNARSASHRASEFDKTADMPDMPPGYRPCPIDTAKAGLPGNLPKRLRDSWKVDPQRFHLLHPDGRHLITDWIERAEAEMRLEPFEAFIYGWIGFNGWASCCCDVERDIALVQMMTLDGRLTATFDRLMKKRWFSDAAQTFSFLWPIFRVSHLPEDIRRDRPSGRRDVVVAYYQSCRPEADRAPECHLRHESQPIQPDWAHTLAALYRVRCNLFHGQKSGAGHEDREILQAAVEVLVPIARSVLNLR